MGGVIPTSITMAEIVSFVMFTPHSAKDNIPAQDGEREDHSQRLQEQGWQKIPSPGWNSKLMKPKAGAAEFTKAYFFVFLFFISKLVKNILIQNFIFE